MLPTYGHTFSLTRVPSSALWTIFADTAYGLSQIPFTPCNYIHIMQSGKGFEITTEKNTLQASLIPTRDLPACISQWRSQRKEGKSSPGKWI